ncbi:DNA-directed DNA polymerase [Senna tora]|uniref:DNA-directed DNA polymerase n=1 Tax=Senna tora TaxID=362788 RepID=A0A834WUN8_9FABA|nr:DNA-directed DNA polymerase [Senna tora]
MKDDNSAKQSVILLGRPFLSTAKTKVDVLEDTFSMEFDGKILKLNAMKRPSEVSSICSVEIVNPKVHEALELHQQENLGIVLIENNCLRKPKESSNTGIMSENLVHELEAMNPKFGKSLTHDSPSSHTKVFASLVQDPKLKLNQLPKHLKHAFLEAQVEQEREVQANPRSTKSSPMMEVFKKEFQKLLDTDMNYPVLDSKIGGKVQWVPKKTGVAVMKSSELGDNIVPKPPN